MELTINTILAPFKAQGMDAGAEQTPHGWFIWIGEWSGTHRDGSQYAELLARKVRQEMADKH